MSRFTDWYSDSQKSSVSVSSQKGMPKSLVHVPSPTHLMRWVRSSGMSGGGLRLRGPALRPIVLGLLARMPDARSNASILSQKARSDA